MPPIVVDCDVGHACCWLLPQALARFVLDAGLNKTSLGKKNQKGYMKLQLCAYMHHAIPFAVAVSTKTCVLAVNDTSQLG
jgi:hypothetical protein